MKANIQITVALEQLERCHTALADFFPHAGLLEIGGSKLLLNTRLMSVLRDCATRVRNSLSGLDASSPDMNGAKLQLLELWSSVIGLLERLGESGSERQTAEVNDAARLLYLASGTSWNYLRGLTPDEAPHNPQYVNVEPMLPLLVRCGRESQAEADTGPKQLAERLSAEINACFR